MNAADLIQRGKDALAYFNRRAAQYEGYDLSLEDLISTLGTEKQRPVHLENLGAFIVENGLSESQVQSAMEGLADKGKGRVPAPGSSTVYFQALGGKLGEINWIDLSKTVALETGSTIVSGFQEAGNAIIETLGMLRMIAPFAVVGAAVWILYSRSRQVAGK